MIESEGITESVTEWRSDIPERFANALGLEKIMFEAADPEVFAWCIKHFGPDVNLFIDHSQILQLETLRRGLWGPADLWGRVVTFKNAPPTEAECVESEPLGIDDSGPILKSRARLAQFFHGNLNRKFCGPTVECKRCRQRKLRWM